jgi:hypothetical protein
VTKYVTLHGIQVDQRNSSIPMPDKLIIRMGPSKIVAKITLMEGEYGTLNVRNFFNNTTSISIYEYTFWSQLIGGPETIYQGNAIFFEVNENGTREITEHRDRLGIYTIWFTIEDYP